MPPRVRDEYKTSIPLRSPAEDFRARATFLRWVWYAARRAELRLDGEDDDFSTAGTGGEIGTDHRADLRLSHNDCEELPPRTRITRYGADETSIPRPGAQADDIPGQRPHTADLPTAATARRSHRPWRAATSSGRPR